MSVGEKNFSDGAQLLKEIQGEYPNYRLSGQLCKKVVRGISAAAEKANKEFIKMQADAQKNLRDRKLI